VIEVISTKAFAFARGDRQSRPAAKYSSTFHEGGQVLTHEHLALPEFASCTPLGCDDRRIKPPCRSNGTGVLVSPTVAPWFRGG
jgi:hypothetical protein